jgi:hypothetical protein
MNPELQPRLDLRQRRRGAFAAGDAVGDDADVMTALDLAVGKVMWRKIPPTGARTTCRMRSGWPSVMVSTCGRTRCRRSPTASAGKPEAK